VKATSSNLKKNEKFRKKSSLRFSHSTVKIALTLYDQASGLTEVDSGYVVLVKQDVMVQNKQLD